VGRDGGSEKHPRDVRAMLAVSGEVMDRPALQDWISRQGVLQEWARVEGK
jgi:hypothetical protein